MSIRSTLAHLLRHVPAHDRDEALRKTRDECASDGDHAGEAACDALLRERGADRASLTWREEDGA